ncbi:MAG: hypothetical protein JKY37_03080 [Nannocystaceae bacterium]|nr:hypothetical protein [Nannocystaceae bacterium]
MRSGLATIYDRDNAKRLWRRPVSEIGGVSWSSDGRRIAITDRHGGAVFDAQTGEVLHERQDLGLVVTDESP